VARFCAIIAATFLALVAAPVAAQPQFPELTGRVVDNADILTAQDEADLTARLESLETQSQRQLVVATVPSLQGYDIADYGYQLGREWGLGDAERNDGALLLVAPNERRVHIATGYGVEGYLTDAFSALIIQNQILPEFREGDYPAGIMAGTNAIVQQLQLPPEEAARIAQEAGEARSSDGGFPFGLLIWIGFIVLFFVLPFFRRKHSRKYKASGRGPWGERQSGRGKRRGRRGSGFGDAASTIILWELGSAIARGAMSGGGGSFGGGGGGFGGGFSGGGGSFGGGGASGGW